MAYPVSGPYGLAARNGLTLSYSIKATYGGAPVTGATDLRPIGGSITDTIAPGVRRTLSLSVAGGHDLYDALAPIGTELTVTATVTYSDQSTASIPMGVFVIDQATITEGAGKITLTAPDRWIKVKRAQFLRPVASTPGLPITQQIVALLQGALGPVTVNVLATSEARVGSLTWTKDRDKAIQDLATSIGAWVYADRTGVLTVADVPVISKTADWLVDASPSGVLITLDRQKSRTSTYNVVAVESSSTVDQAFPTVIAWDSDPASPTFAGYDPVGNPGQAGPFGIVPYLYSDSVITDATAAGVAARAILAKTVGSASSINATQLPNPAMDAFDVLDVLPPGRVLGSRPGSGTLGIAPGLTLYPGADTYPADRGSPPVSWALGTWPPMERHIADTVTHPLDVTSALQVAGRSTRTDPYT